MLHATTATNPKFIFEFGTTKTLSKNMKFSVEKQHFNLIFVTMFSWNECKHKYLFNTTTSSEKNVKRTVAAKTKYDGSVHFGHLHGVRRASHSGRASPLYCV
jgi:hypothetical protein